MKLAYLATVLMPAGMAMAAAKRETVYGTVSSTATPTATRAPSHFQLKTQVKPREPAKDAFDNLYVYPYYTAPDLYDAALTHKKSRAPTARANYGTVGGVSGPAYFDVVFNMTSHTTDRSFQLSPQDNINYAARWEPVCIDTGLGTPSSGSTFFLQGDTLQWTDEAGFFRPASFYGWLVCQWWDANEDTPSEPGLQLFFRFDSADGAIPSTCADVDLVLESASET